MKNVLIAATALGLLILGFFGIRALISQKPKQAALQVSSTPRSTVFLDDKHVGQTPFYDEKLKPGEYVVKLMPETEATKAASWLSKVKLNPETLTVINREFGETEEKSSGYILSLEFLGKKKEPELAVLVNPDGAGVKVNGDFKGTAPLVISNISEGDHEVDISLADYSSMKVKVKIVKGYRLTVNAELAKGKEEKVTPTPTPKEKLTPEPTKTEEKPASPAAEKKFEIGVKIIIKETETGWLRVRLEPSLSGSEAAKVNPGQEFTVLDEQSGWVKIEYEKNKEGWVSGNYVSPK